ncbi:MAG: hypothetical protein HUJ31_14970, partial [Pseudomonadales bacterium]|nr:hypothetical protein [Pseudomonadales bacterium]
MRFFCSVLLALLVTALAVGCASKRAYVGYPATNLGGLIEGVERKEVDAVLGLPERVEVVPAGAIAYYVIDRGFVGNLEETNPGAKIAWAPVMAWGELVTLGLSGWLVGCQVPCQKAWLAVVYDNAGRLVTAHDTLLPDEHPLVTHCAGSAVRGEVAVCQGVRQQLRPLTLPAKTAPAGVDAEPLPG